MKKGTEIGNKEVLCSELSGGRDEFSGSAAERAEVQPDREAAVFGMDSVTLPAVERKRNIKKDAKLLPVIDSGQL